MRKPIEVRILLRGTLRETIRTVARVLKRNERDEVQVYGPRFQYEYGQKFAVVYRIFNRGLKADDVFKLDAKVLTERHV